MPTGAERSGRDLGKAFGLFAGAFVLFLAVIAMLAEAGLPQPVIAFLVIGVATVTFVVIGVVCRTLSLREFYVAGRSVPTGFNGLASAAAFLSIAGFAGLAGAFYADAAAGLAVVVGWAAGFVLLAVLVAPYYRKSGAVTLPDFLAVRFGNPLVRLVGVAALLISSFALLPAALAVAGLIGQSYLGISREFAIVAATVVLLLSSLFGGMRAVTYVAGAQAIVVILAVLAPAVLISARDYGLPVPQFTFGYALAQAGTAADWPGALPSLFLPVAGLDGFNLAALALSFACGVAALPHLVARSGTTRGVSGARRSVAWGLAVVVAVLITAPAIAAFVRLAIVDNIIGAALDDLPAWVFAYGELGLVRICGVDAVSVELVRTVCGAAIDNGIAAGDFAIAADAVIFAFADASGLPYPVTALLVAGGLAATLATAGAVLIAITACLGHDLYGGLLDRRAPAGRRLIVSRLILIVVAVVSGWIAVHWPDDMYGLAALAPSLAASAFLPALVLGVWWKRTTFWGALLGIVGGLAVAVFYAFLTRDGTVAPWSVLGPTGQGLPGIAAAMLGVPAGFVVAVLVSLVTRAPSAARREVIDAIRRPTRDPVLEDHAA